MMRALEDFGTGWSEHRGTEPRRCPCICVRPCHEIPGCACVSRHEIPVSVQHAILWCARVPSVTKFRCVRVCGVRPSQNSGDRVSVSVSVSVTKFRVSGARVCVRPFGLCAYISRNSFLPGWKTRLVIAKLPGWRKHAGCLHLLISPASHAIGTTVCSLSPYSNYIQQWDSASVLTAVTTLAQRLCAHNRGDDTDSLSVCAQTPR